MIFTLTADTVLSFDFFAPAAAEVVGIGLDSNGTGNDPIRYFQLAGTETTGSFAGLSPGAAYEGGWQRYEIRLADFNVNGAYAIGAVLNRFVFVNDNDAGHAGEESYFRNIQLTEGPPPPAGVTHQVAYTHDAAGRRVKRALDSNGAAPGGLTNQYFVYSAAPSPSGRGQGEGELSMTFGHAGELTHRYLHGPQVDQVLVDEVFSNSGGQQVSDEVLWLLADHQGTIRDVVDSTGTLRKHVDYDSFGQVTGENYFAQNGSAVSGSHAEAIDQLFYFQGREFDEATGLSNHRARWYNPGTGRFLNEDPSGFDAGDPNLYRFAANNPVSYTDPSGLKTYKPTEYLPALTATSTRNNNIPTADQSVRQLNASIGAYDYYNNLAFAATQSRGAAPATSIPATRAATVRAPSPPSSSLLNPNLLTSAGNTVRGVANYVASGIENVTATGNTGLFGSALAVYGGVQSHNVRLAGNIAGGVIDVPGTAYAAIQDVRATVDVYNRYGAGAAGARQVGLLQGAEAYYGTDVLTFDSVDPFAKLSEASARIGSTAGTAAGFAAGVTRLTAPNKIPHGNSLDFVGDTHVYRIKAPDGSTYKIGESMQGVRVSDGASIRAEQQVRQLNRTFGPGHTSEIRRTFPDKASARDYETRLIDRFRSMFGDDTLPGNRTNR